jgi:hypothetical protein
VEVQLRLVVVEDAAAAEQQQVEALDRVRQLVAQRLASVHHVLHRVVGPSVLDVTREDRQLDAGDALAQLLQHHREDRLVTHVQASIGATDADGGRSWVGVEPRHVEDWNRSRIAGYQRRPGWIRPW